LADSAAAAGKIPDSQKIDLPPGKYKVSFKVASFAAQTREFEVCCRRDLGPDTRAQRF